MERIVMKGKYYPHSGGKLTFDASKRMYTCYYAGKKLWSEPGRKDLYEYVTSGQYYDDDAQIESIEEREQFEEKLYSTYPVLYMYRASCAIENLMKI